MVLHEDSEDFPSTPIHYPPLDSISDDRGNENKDYDTSFAIKRIFEREGESRRGLETPKIWHMREQCVYSMVLHGLIITHPLDTVNPPLTLNLMSEESEEHHCLDPTGTRSRKRRFSNYSIMLTHHVISVISCAALNEHGICIFNNWILWL
jgi:hypothetical protein